MTKTFEQSQTERVLNGMEQVSQHDWYVGIAQSYINVAKNMITPEGKAANYQEAASYLRMASNVLIRSNV